MIKKIFLSTLMILFLTLALMGFLTLNNSKSLYYDFVEDGLDRALSAIELSISGTEDFYNAESNTMIQNTVLNNEYRITLIDNKGNVVYDTDRDAETMENHLDRPEVKSAFADEPKRTIRHSDSIKADMMYLARKIYLDEAETAVVRLSMRLSLTEDIYYQSLKNMLFYILFSFFVAAFFSRYILAYLLKPVKEISLFAKSIAGGNYTERMTWFKRDEIGDLTDSLNDMADELQDTFNLLSDRNSELEVILANIVDGIIAIDNNMSVKIINKSAKEILEITENEKVIGKNIFEIIRTIKIFDELKRFVDDVNSGTLVSFESEISGKIVRLTISKISENDFVQGYILVLQNVTQIRKLENIRKDFVANVSHELKTPITSIKGFIETLKEGVEDERTREQFYNIIHMETERLIDLVEDILTLSFLDNENNIKGLNKEWIDPKTNLEEAVEISKNLAKEKGIEIKVETSENLPRVLFNKDYFRQMCLNLIGNAIKFSNENSQIIIRMYKDPKSVKLEVLDSGIGIAEEDLERIFERFYRVEKGRARKEGGTGLGLAIVKHIVQSQGGEIKVSSKVNEGTVFTVSFNYVKNDLSGNDLY
ncbi:sensor histidine kinase [Alkalibacter mobilis]|uniref:sensor histidine kinase n=1 Tax=Alkalibacter mobilis TaxID=2787712 RepID=UPI00189D1F12|nr:ATP-binding protein [Alkalibacter mobilis]MBF7095876.1 HAMP domain-containing protein [Alkalibacter mobilis]